MPQMDPKGWGLVLLLAMLAWSGLVVAEGSVPLRLALLSTEADYSPEEVLAGRAGEFRALPGGRVLLPGGSGRTHWIRIEAELDGQADAHDPHRVLWFDRVPVAEFELHVPVDGGWWRQSRSFFAPGPEEELLASGFVFLLPPLPDGKVVMLAQVRNRVAVSLRPILESEWRYRLGDRRMTVALSAIYAGLVVLALIGLALFAAMREPLYLKFVGFALAAWLLLTAVNGHLYAIPGLRWLGISASPGLFALGHATAACIVLLARQFAGLGACAPRLDAILGWTPWLLLALAALSLGLPLAAADVIQVGSTAAWAGAGALCIGSSAIALRHGRPLALPMLLLWFALLVSACARPLVSYGWLPQNVWTMYGFQLALVASVFLLMLGLTGRVMEFRKQRDRARLAKEQADASLKTEQGRRRFAESLAALREADNGDIEWLAFRRLLESLRPLVPQQGSAVLAFGYHGLDLLLAEPIALKERYSRMLGARGGTLKGLCRSRNPVQVLLDDGQTPGEGSSHERGLFAVVPLRMDKPGWGALLIERQPWESFDHNELRLAAEFAAMATQAADEAAAARELRRKAELDSLTGAYNRHAMDTLLARAMAAAHAAHSPLSILFVDLDHFKQVNDRHGHTVGDQCLRVLAETIRRMLGPDDLFGRYGGEEFIIVLPGRAAEQARQFGERLRVTVSELRIGEGEDAVRFTVSIGIAGRQASEHAAQPVIDRADRALYTAKRSGRNQVQMAPS
ncbi:diguanylate cyclase [Rehaibacterium terrae]|jgi:diguanylate cyclase (GGDEF)-like protein|uniref:diguanylate cyclase n=2 Tax=Rehaibacterium terrae TaxID=1341696 RepID=A0A7W8DFK3_9GAMM|nr:diguanylate cyclase [Rehaibacterium terrae]MBB5016518.1 diguanylate cyclase (GGDEF)-like protein [Rehaibacterium terrae]